MVLSAIPRVIRKHFLLQLLNQEVHNTLLKATGVHSRSYFQKIPEPGIMAALLE
jgi:hypothetical protein